MNDNNTPVHKRNISEDIENDFSLHEQNFSLRRQIRGSMQPVPQTPAKQKVSFSPDISDITSNSADKLDLSAITDYKTPDDAQFFEAKKAEDKKNYQAEMKKFIENNRTLLNSMHYPSVRETRFGKNASNILGVTLAYSMIIVGFTISGLLIQTVIFSFAVPCYLLIKAAVYSKRKKIYRDKKDKLQRRIAKLMIRSKELKNFDECYNDIVENVKFDYNQQFKHKQFGNILEQKLQKLIERLQITDILPVKFLRHGLKIIKTRLEERNVLRKLNAVSKFLMSHEASMTKFLERRRCKIINISTGYKKNSAKQNIPSFQEQSTTPLFQEDLEKNIISPFNVFDEKIDKVVLDQIAKEQRQTNREKKLEAYKSEPSFVKRLKIAFLKDTKCFRI